MFVASANSNRWKKVKEDIAESVTSFGVVAAPKVRAKKPTLPLLVVNNAQELSCTAMKSG